MKSLDCQLLVLSDSKAKIGDEEISLGDCVTVEPNDPTIPVFIGRVIYLWQDKNKEKHFHARWFWYVHTKNFVLEKNETDLNEIGWYTAFDRYCDILAN